MMSVLVGSEGVVRAGRSDRSSDREGECRRFMPDVGDMGCGDVWIAAIVCGCDSLSTEIDASVCMLDVQVVGLYMSCWDKAGEVRL